MYVVKEYIAQQKQRLSEHKFFSQLQPDPVLDRAMAFAPALTFWIMTFQDVLRLNAKFTRDPNLRNILQQHLIEDSGHDRWFLEDLNVIFGDDQRDIIWLFGQENTTTREAAFAIASEVFRARHDSLRLVLIEAMEAAFQVFFPRVARCLKESGYDGRLNYFAGLHLAAEANHEMFEAVVKRQILAINLSEEDRHEAFSLVDRVFDAFIQMWDGLLPLMEKTGTPSEASDGFQSLREQPIAT